MARSYMDRGCGIERDKRREIAAFPCCDEVLHHSYHFLFAYCFLHRALLSCDPTRLYPWSGKKSSVFYCRYMARYEELRYRLQLLVAEFPTLLTLRVLGSMRHHGKTYDVLRLELREAGGEEKGEVCLAFGTHGNEDLTAESVEEFLKSLLDPSSTNPLIDLPSTEERQRLRETFALKVYFFNPIGFDRTERS